MFDENLPSELKGVDQISLLEYVLERSDPRIGMYVTMHRADAKVLTSARCQQLRARFPNFLYDPPCSRLRGHRSIHCPMSIAWSQCLRLLD